MHLSSVNRVKCSIPENPWAWQTWATSISRSLVLLSGGETSSTLTSSCRQVELWVGEVARCHLQRGVEHLGDGLGGRQAHVLLDVRPAMEGEGV